MSVETQTGNQHDLLGQRVQRTATSPIVEKLFLSAEAVVYNPGFPSGASLPLIPRENEGQIVASYIDAELQWAVNINESRGWWP